MDVIPPTREQLQKKRRVKLSIAITLGVFGVALGIAWIRVVSFSGEVGPQLVPVCLGIWNFLAIILMLDAVTFDAQISGKQCEEVREMTGVSGRVRHYVAAVAGQGRELVADELGTLRSWATEDRERAAKQVLYGRMDSEDEACGDRAPDPRTPKPSPSQMP